MRATHAPVYSRYYLMSREALVHCGDLILGMREDRIASHDHLTWWRSMPDTHVAIRVDSIQG